MNRNLASGLAPAVRAETLDIRRKLKQLEENGVGGTTTGIDGGTPWEDFAQSEPIDGGVP